MIEIKREELLKDTPEYESYTENEAKLPEKEMMELGIQKCIGKCCKGKTTNCECKYNKKCCQK